MLIKLFMTLIHLSPKSKRWLWQQWYQFLARSYPIPDWTFMNYGYAPLTDQGGGDKDGDNRSQPVALDAVDEANRYAIQLYHHVAHAVRLEGLDVLEVGSGRGGGSAYIARYLQPATMTGVDFSQKAVEFATRSHPVDKLTFMKGNAESLPFADSCFDVVINVESSHCYGSMEAFLAQVRRVLRPEGHFLFADFRGSEEAVILHRQLENSGLKILQEHDITPNVIRSLDIDNQKKLTLIHNSFHKWLLGYLQEFAAVKGSQIYAAFQNRSMVYKYYVLQK
jgi:ubiquinone/menaquinone biosynthesis C-methylase UbiE